MAAGGQHQRRRGHLYLLGPLKRLVQQHLHLLEARGLLAGLQWPHRHRHFLAGRLRRGVAVKGSGHRWSAHRREPVVLVLDGGHRGGGQRDLLTPIGPFGVHGRGGNSNLLAELPLGVHWGSGGRHLLAKAPVIGFGGHGRGGNRHLLALRISAPVFDWGIHRRGGRRNLIPRAPGLSRRSHQLRGHFLCGHRHLLVVVQARSPRRLHRDRGRVGGRHLLGGWPQRAHIIISGSGRGLPKLGSVRHKKVLRRLKLPLIRGILRGYILRGHWDLGG
mmetsp:Transcript_89261/g.213193  ORF Transcript_89261/g.213193 Transcript_89261/m.213193 type:complete len:275 (-) Transcript_89261:220-1044(-)